MVGNELRLTPLGQVSSSIRSKFDFFTSNTPLKATLKTLLLSLKIPKILVVSDDISKTLKLLYLKKAPNLAEGV